MRHDANVNAFLRLEKVTTSAEQLRSALERRAMRMKEHPILQVLEFVYLSEILLIA